MIIIIIFITLLVDLLHYRSIITLPVDLLHYRSIITLPVDLLHYWLIITLPVDYYITGCNMRPCMLSFLQPFWLGRTKDSVWMNRSLKIITLRESNDEKIQDSRKLIGFAFLECVDLYWLYYQVISQTSS